MLSALAPSQSPLVVTAAALGLLSKLKDKKIFLEFHTITVVTGLKYWLTSRDIHLSADEAMEYYLFLMSHPILELLEK